MASSLFSASDLDRQGSPVAGPMAVLITVAPGTSHAAALRSLDHITAVLNGSSDGPVGGVVGALRPAEIANYRTVGTTPALLAGVLAVGAIGALGLTLVASVRQRRRQFALLKALGFTQRQIAASVAWQSSVAALVGVLAGVPIGIALGRWLWILFAGRQLGRAASDGADPRHHGRRTRRRRVRQPRLGDPGPDRGPTRTSLLLRAE